MHDGPMTLPRHAVARAADPWACAPRSPSRWPHCSSSSSAARRAPGAEARVAVAAPLRRDPARRRDTRRARSRAVADDTVTRHRTRRARRCRVRAAPRLRRAAPVGNPPRGGRRSARRRPGGAAVRGRWRGSRRRGLDGAVRPGRHDVGLGAGKRRRARGVGRGSRRRRRRGSRRVRAPGSGGDGPRRAARRAAGLPRVQRTTGVAVPRTRRRSVRRVPVGRVRALGSPVDRATGLAPGEPVARGACPSPMVQSWCSAGSDAGTPSPPGCAITSRTVSSGPA